MNFSDSFSFYLSENRQVFHEYIVHSGEVESGFTLIINKVFVLNEVVSSTHFLRSGVRPLTEKGGPGVRPLSESRGPGVLHEIGRYAR